MRVIWVCEKVKVKIITVVCSYDKRRTRDVSEILKILCNAEDRNTRPDALLANSKAAGSAECVFPVFRWKRASLENAVCLSSRDSVRTKVLQTPPWLKTNGGFLQSPNSGTHWGENVSARCIAWWREAKSKRSRVKVETFSSRKTKYCFYSSGNLQRPNGTRE